MLLALGFPLFNSLSFLKMLHRNMLLVSNPVGGRNWLWNPATFFSLIYITLQITQQPTSLHAAKLWLKSRSETMSINDYNTGAVG